MELTLDQLVVINGITGYVDYIGSEEIVLITLSNELQCIKIKNIKTAHSLQIINKSDIARDCVVQLDIK